MTSTRLLRDQPTGANVTGHEERIGDRGGPTFPLGLHRQAGAIHSVLPDGPELAAGMVPGR
jgi:hypothetical protein